jgi:hypothetical protein
MNTIYNEFKRWKNDAEATDTTKPEAKKEDSKDNKNQKKNEAKPPT